MLYFGALLRRSAAWGGFAGVEVYSDAMLAAAGEVADHDADVVFRMIDHGSEILHIGHGGGGEGGFLDDARAAAVFVADVDTETADGWGHGFPAAESGFSLTSAGAKWCIAAHYFPAFRIPEFRGAPLIP